MKTINIPGRIYDRIEELIQGTSFESVEDYIVRKLEAELGTWEEEYTDEEREKIMEHLRTLGYIE